MSSGGMIFQLADDAPYQKIWDYQGGDQPIYEGWATPGVPTSSYQWRIVQYTYVTVTVSGSPISVLSQMQFANGDVGFHNVWNSSGGISYTGGATFK